MSDVLTTRDLAVGYGEKLILTNINLQLQQGDIICLLGANGCGKTTLMKTLLGLLPPKTGEIRINGKPLNHWSATALARRVAYVPQAHNMPFSFRVLDMVALGRSAHLSLFASPGRAERQMAEQELDALGIAHLALRAYSCLSGGEKQLVLIARALIQQPGLLIMDEPAASLDFGNQIKLLNKIEQLRERGITVLMSTHHPQHAAAVADSIVMLGSAQPARQDKPAALLTPETLAALYHVTPEHISAHFAQPTYKGLS
ncbi:ABC transporter ATP-binding protein [Morganella psychrotolerans]|uniref:ABC transporter ATP-binding protein n=1 Tax=Morganella psychrotolerans TaxID=368603 RepID=A0A5M9R3D1_9GAMM|nr:ABC transporter ATP-binding protein [Morganella psychrotolerans]KAA8715444.1 ABC transporter ATP-binding protein [Morganella psychrotolerans]OBU05762.1 iron ABC transporter ATP-binding protein [Morganella psychrotolerans]